MSILRKIGMQFKKPVGIPGMIISNMMIIENRSAYVNIIGDLMIQASDKNTGNRLWTGVLALV
jgi:hypothetical protein